MKRSRALLAAAVLPASLLGACQPDTESWHVDVEVPELDREPDESPQGEEAERTADAETAAEPSTGEAEDAPRGSDSR